jgi:uncharacterized membrane protein HdeD (DUF308 family)
MLEVRFQPESTRWSVQLGVALMLLGAAALTTMSPAGAAGMLFGWIVVLAGLVEATHAFRVRRSSAFFLHLIPGIAGFPIGLLMAAHPSAGVLASILLLGSFFTVVGLFRVVAAFRLKFPAWPWAVFDGVATFVLGTILWSAWQWLGPRFFGLAVGVSLLLRGWSCIAFALAVRRLPDNSPAHSCLSESQRAVHKPASRNSQVEAHNF